MKYLYTALTTFFFMTSNASAFDHSHKVFDELLSAHVKMSKDKTSSTVDYKNFDKKKLKTYLDAGSAVSKKEFKTFNKNQKLAFFINTYNAYTIKLILDHYPVKSIKDTGSRSFSNLTASPWKMKFFKLFGDKTSLDEIEHEYTRGNDSLNKDPRIHFAFNCASIGCPALLNNAWVSTRLEEQFDAAAKGFLKDRSRNRLNLKDKNVEISNIFKWYGKDFDSAKYGSLKKFIMNYADAITDNQKEKTFVLSGDFDISYTGYNWSLNDSK
jgi:hypothetical protein